MNIQKIAVILEK